MKVHCKPTSLLRTLMAGSAVLMLVPAARAEFKIVDGANEFAINLWIDAQGEYVKGTGGFTPSALPNARVRLNQNSSELRFTGTRTLGNGLQAFATVGSEMRTLNSTDATTSATTVSNTFGFRNTGVGLRGGFGEVAIGRWDVHYQYYPAIAGIDSSYLTGPIAWASGAVIAFHSYSTDLIGNRYANTLRYSSPTWAGLTVHAAYTRNDGGASNAVTGLPNQQDRGGNIALTYRDGPIAATASYFRRSGFVLPLPYTTINSSVQQSSLRIGFKYTLPMGLSLALGVDQSENKHDAPTAGGERTTRRTSWAVPVEYRSGPHDVSATYAQAGEASGDLLPNSPIATNRETGGRFYHLGYKFWFDKDTNIHIGWARMANQANANYDLYLGGALGIRGNRALAGAATQSAQIGFFTRF